MSVRKPPTDSFAWNGQAGRPMALYVNGGMDVEVQIGWHMRAPDDTAVSILFGEEQITLEFFDVESLERLRDVAEEGAQRLRAAMKANA